jgi:hypothetical protein
MNALHQFNRHNGHAYRLVRSVSEVPVQVKHVVVFSIIINFYWTLSKIKNF